MTNETNGRATSLRERDETPTGETGAAEGASVRLSAYDRVVLDLDRPDNLFVVVLVILLPPSIDADAVARTLTERAGRVALLRRCILRGGAPCWTPDPDFDPARHVRRVEGRRDLAEEIAEAFVRPFEAGRPAWEFRVLDGDRERTPLLLRIHHVYGDGAAIETLLAPLVDADVERSATPTGARAMPSGGALTAGILREPFRMARVAAEIVRTIVRPPDRLTSLRAKLSGRKRVTWSAPLDLPSLKKLAQALHCSITDLLASGYTRALRELLERREAVGADDWVRASVTATVRRRGEARPMGNRFGLMAIDLPLGAGAPGARLNAIKRQLDRDKNASQGLASYLLTAAIGRLPTTLRRLAAMRALSRYSVILTHISGPPHAFRIGGHRAQELIAFAPPAGESGLCVTAISYDGRMSIAAAADAAITDSPETLIAAIEREIDDLAEASAPALQSSLQCPIDPDG